MKHRVQLKSTQNTLQLKTNLSKPFNLEVFDNVLAILGDFVFKQQHKETPGNITQQVPAPIAVYLTKAVDCALLQMTVAPINQCSN